MGLLRLLVTGAAVAAGAHYITKKRPDGTSIADDLKAKAPEWMEKAKPYTDKVKPYIDQVKGQFANVKSQQGSTQQGSYPNKYDNFSADPDPSYSS